jgi:hypothetical protein
MSPIKMPCRVNTMSASGIIFLGKGWPTLKAHATGPRCGPVSGSPSSRPGCCRVPVLLRCPDLSWPARCSRDTAKVAVFRFASPTRTRVLPRRGSHQNRLPALGREECVPKDGERRGCSCATPESEPSTGGGSGRSGPSERRNGVRR